MIKKELKLYSLWNKQENPRAKAASWFRYRQGITHCNPNRYALVKILLPVFKAYARSYVRRVERGDSSEEALNYAIANGRGASNITAGNLSVELANNILEYFVQNGHVEILEAKLKDSLALIRDQLGDDKT